MLLFSSPREEASKAAPAIRFNLLFFQVLKACISYIFSNSQYQSLPLFSNKVQGSPPNPEGNLTSHCSVRVAQETRWTQRAKEQGLLAGNKREGGASQGRLRLMGESRANLGRLGSQPREVRTHSVVLRAGFLKRKNPRRVTGWGVRVWLARAGCWVPFLLTAVLDTSCQVQVKAASCYAG